MSMISEQVRKIRTMADIIQHSGIKLLLTEAADTIETLSTKLASENMERSDRYYGIGWISVESRPKQIDSESSRPVLVRYKDDTADPDICRYNFITSKFVFADRDCTKFIKEWHEIPK